MNSTQVSTVTPKQPEPTQKQPSLCARACNVTTIEHALKVAAIAAAAFAIFGLVTGTTFGLPFIPFVILAAGAITGGAVSSAMLVRQIYVACMNRPAKTEQPNRQSALEDWLVSKQARDFRAPYSSQKEAVDAADQILKRFNEENSTPGISEEDPNDKIFEINDKGSSGSPESRSSTLASLPEPDLSTLPLTYDLLLANDIFKEIQKFAAGKTIGDSKEARNQLVESAECIELVDNITRQLFYHPRESQVLDRVSECYKADASQANMRINMMIYDEKVLEVILSEYKALKEELEKELKQEKLKQEQDEITIKIIASGSSQQHTTILQAVIEKPISPSNAASTTGSNLSSDALIAAANANNAGFYSDLSETDSLSSASGVSDSSVNSMVEEVNRPSSSELLPVPETDQAKVRMNQRDTIAEQEAYGHGHGYWGVE